MFINHTNHPSQYWSDAQLDTGRQYGVIMDMPFPQIDPMASSAEISQLAQEYAARIIALHPTAVLCQGGIHLLSRLSGTIARRRDYRCGSHQ